MGDPQRYQLVIQQQRALIERLSRRLGALAVENEELRMVVEQLSARQAREAASTTMGGNEPPTGGGAPDG